MREHGLRMEQVSVTIEKMLNEMRYAFAAGAAWMTYLQ